MDEGGTSINGRPLLLLFTGILFAGCAESSKQCEIDSLPVTSYWANSTFMFNVVFRDPSCTNKGNLDVELTSCNNVNKSYGLYRGQAAGMTIECWETGEKMLSASMRESPETSVQSNCFNCIGLEVEPPTHLLFSTKVLEMKFTDPHRNVTGWNLTVYKKTDNDFVCDKYTKMEYIKSQFSEIDLQLQNTKPEGFKKKHDFDMDAYYCFVLQPISPLPLWPKHVILTNKDCKPNPFIPEDGVLGNGNQPPLSSPQRALLVILLVIAIAVVAILVVAFVKPQVLRRILGLQKQTGQKGQCQESLLPQTTHVLLLYAPDVSCCDHMDKMKRKLKNNFQVYDIYDGHIKWLDDRFGRMEEMLMPGSGVKLLLVESPGLKTIIDSLLTTDPENPIKMKMAQISPQLHTSDRLLTFALSTIIRTNLREDYSTVYVVRFTDKERDVADLLVHTRRYKFSDHFPELIQDMKVAKCATKGKEVV